MEFHSSETRKEAFRSLVQAQDQGDSVEDSRTKVAIQYDLSIEQVRDIEREGIQRKWPPLQP